jgi:hypothetical protein
MKSKLNLLNKILISVFGSFLFIILISFLVFGKNNFNNFISIISGSAIAVALFFISIFVYKILLNKNSSNTAKIVIFSYLAKVVFIALIFLLIVKFSNFNRVNFFYFFISFLIVYSVLLNIEIYMIYKKVLFKR